MDTPHNETKATKIKKEKQSALRQSIARRKIETLTELKRLGLDHDDLILITS